MIRKNKKRIDPRYFLHELHEEDVAAGTTVAEAPPPPTQVTQPEETKLGRLSEEQKEGARRMLEVVHKVLEGHSIAKGELDRTLQDEEWPRSQDPTAEEEQI